MFRIMRKAAGIFYLIIALSSHTMAQGWDQAALSSANSGSDEQNPVLSPDGKYLFFTKANHESNVDGKRDPGDIWFSMLQETGWTTPVHAGPLLNDRAYNAVAGFSADGQQLYLLSHYNKTGGVAKTQGLSVATKTNAGWSEPVNISIPYFQNKSSIQSGYVSPDGKVFVFAAETYGSYGVEDLYVSLKVGDQWSEPKNLGGEINTTFQELSPSLSPDGKTLYFSSNGRRGIGSFDVYMTQRKDDTWRNWTPPVNLGPDINTTGRELFFRMQGDFALYTSTTNSDGYGDIKFFKPHEPQAQDSVVIVSNPAADTAAAIQITPVQQEVARDAIVIYGKVTNTKNNAGIAAHVVFNSGGGPVEVRANAAGEYKIELKPVGIYQIKIDAPKYVSALERLDMNTNEMQALELNFKLQPVEVGTTVNLKNVLFVQGKTELLPESYAELDLVAGFMRDNPKVRIELAGHTDNRGVHAHNVKLSQARVDAVIQYLVEHGIDKKRMTGKGYGGVKPIASNDSEESRQLNRRVEFIIKKT